MNDSLPIEVKPVLDLLELRAHQSPVYPILVREVATEEARRPLGNLSQARRLLVDAVSHFEHNVAQGKRIDLSCVHRQTLLRIATLAVQALREFQLETAADAIDQDIPF